MINGATLQRNVKVINGKFTVMNIPALGAGDLVNVVYQKKTFPKGVVVLGSCQDNSVVPCLDVPLDRDVSVSGKNAVVGFQVVVNPTNPTPETVIIAAGDVSAGAFKVAVSKLSQYDKVELHDAKGKVLAGPLKPQPAKQPPACSQSSKNLPCLKPVKSTDKSVTGFAVPGSKVEIAVNNVNKGQPGVDSTTGAFTLELSSLAKGQTITATQVTPAPGPGTKPATVTVTDASASNSTAALYTLGLVGVNVAGASNTGPNQQFFASFDTRMPLPFLGSNACTTMDENYVMERKCWIWFNPRIASAPTPSSSALKSFSSPSSLATGINGETLGQIAQTIEIQAGMEYKLFHGPRVPTSNTVAFRGGLSLILGGGVVTPINSTSNASVFTLNANLGNQFTENSLATNNGPTSFANTYPTLASALCSHFGYTSTPACTPSAVAYGNVAFVLPNRSRFYRDYFAGFRLSTYFFKGDCTKKSTSADGDTASSCQTDNIYPGTFDIRFGQDETVTAGYRRGVVMTLAGSYPLPGTSGTVRIFGSMDMRLHHNENTPSLALTPASSSVSITDPSVVIQAIRPSDHDYYRLGLGVDLVPLITKWTTSSSNSSSSNGSGSSQ